MYQDNLLLLKNKLDSNNINKESLLIQYQDIHNILIGFGFTPVVYEPISRKLTRLNNYNHGCNTIYVKDIDIMASRCKLAPLRCVHTAFDRYL